MKRQILTIIALLISGFLFAQKSLTDLENELPSLKEGEKLRVLIQLSDGYLNKEPKKTIEFGREAVKIIRKLGAENQTKAKVYNLLGQACYVENNLGESVNFYKKELEILVSIDGGGEKTIRALFNVATLNREIGNNSEAIENYKLCIDVATNLKKYEMVVQACNAISGIYEQMGKYKQAFEAYKELVVARDLMENRKTIQEISVIRSQYESAKEEKERKERELQNKEKALNESKNKEKVLVQDSVQKSKKIKDLNEESTEKDSTIKQKDERIKEEEENVRLQREVSDQRQQLIYLFIFIIAAMAVFSFVLIRLITFKRRANKRLKMQNEEILKQKSEIEAKRDEISLQKDEITKQHAEITKQNKDIRDSIHYAKRIQVALLPSYEICEKVLKDYFVLFSPKDIVSGDFYWFSETEDKIIIVAADCTGHGVPGGFMSMLGMTFLNDIVNRKGVTEPDEILNQLRKEVINALQQEVKSKNELKDGMDIALLTLNKRTLWAEFAGAYNSLYLIRNGVLQEIEADKMPIAIYAKMKPFNKQIFQAEKNDLIYLYSDGYVSQFGGPQKRKFMSSRFKELLVDIRFKTMFSQKETLWNTLIEWKNDEDQIDDILVIGIRV